MKFKVTLKNNVSKDLQHLPFKEVEKLSKSIFELQTNPKPNNSEKMKGYDFIFRLKKGNYRIIYEIDELNYFIKILRVAHRKDVYKGF